MKNIKFISFACLLLTLAHCVKAQGVLEYHSGVSVQRMPDGATFRFLTGDSGDDSLQEYDTYVFKDYSPTDTVIWKYVKDEDQLYILSWDPKKAAKKHDIKFAVAWRVTSGNPRFGKVSVPGNLHFEGFGGNEAYFTEPGKPDYFKLFFYTTYITATGTVDYTLKAHTIPTIKPAEWDYPSYEPNFNYSGKKVPNPFNMAALDRKMKQKETEELMAVSLPLYNLLNQIDKQPEDETWGKADLKLTSYDNGFEWDDFDRLGRDYVTLCVYVEDKYYTKNTIYGTIVSTHPQLFGNRDVSFESFYHKDGIIGWKVVLRVFPYMFMRLKLDVPANTPVLTVRYKADENEDVKDYLAAESKYANDKNVQDIVKDEDPAQKAQALWGTYALNNYIACSAEELMAALIDVYKAGGDHYDGYGSMGWSRSNMYQGNMSPKYQDITVLIVAPVAPISFMLRGNTSNKFTEVPLKEMDVLTGQRLRVFKARVTFEGNISSYEFKIDPGFYGENGYMIFLSKP